MYFPVGWPRVTNLALPNENVTIHHICCDAVKILIAAVSDDYLGVWYANPLLPIVFHKRNKKSIATQGNNKLIVWKPDSRQLVILTNRGVLLLYQIDYDSSGSGIFMQVDPPTANLKRDSAELFLKENIPCLSLRELGSSSLGVVLTTCCCISLTELLAATNKCELIRIQWKNLTAESSIAENNEPTFASINLRNIPFYVNKNCHLKNHPPIGDRSYVAALEYSPLIGGCAAVFTDNRAAFLIATHLRFDAQNMHGFWVPDDINATVCSVNHKFRLLAYGRYDSEVSVYGIEEATGGLELSHRLSLNSSVIPGTLGSVSELKWSPDGCVLAVAWKNGGISLWSTFGALLMSSFNWDFGVNVDLVCHNPLCVEKMEWSTEGYQLFMICEKNANNRETSIASSSNVLQLNFVKSTLTMNTCMSTHSYVLLQGDDTIYLNQGESLENVYFGSKYSFPNSHDESSFSNKKYFEDSIEIKKSIDSASILSESKYWTVLQLPLTYAATNWPIRYSAIDSDGMHLAVAGRTGIAHYSMLTKKWKLFGNESQEKDFVAMGGLFWWNGFIVMGCYSLLDRTDEIRCYPKECKLDNQFGNKIQLRAAVILLNMLRDQLIALTSDSIVSLFILKKVDSYSLNVTCVFEVDVKSICIHPACIVSLTVTNLRNDNTKNSFAIESASDTDETIIVNVCGRILMIQRDVRNTVINSLMASCLASCVERFWLSNTIENSPMGNGLWLYSGIHGMRVWLPILPPANQQVRDAQHRHHTFMSKRIMLSFPLKLYPLVILFDNVIALGVENETTLYTTEAESHFALPFSFLERKSQVYLHKILRQLIKRNLGYNAWEIAKSCRSLPYFPHSLELLLHEVLEEEATSKEPIPDALLPRILDFIREFPVYLQTIVQCARKTEIALWPYLFSMAGKPKDLFQLCLQSGELETAASYLIIIQNLEPSVISKQYATLLLDIALQNCNWDLAKDLIRFLKAIDPSEIDSPRSSMVVNVKIAPPTQPQSQVNQNPDVFNLVLGPIARERSFSTTVITNVPKEKKEKPVSGGHCGSPPAPSLNSLKDTSLSSLTNNKQILTRRKSERSAYPKERKETFCIESILQRHARKFLQQCKLIELGYMSAFLDFHFVTWLSQEADRSAKLDDFVVALSCLHEELRLPPPFLDSQMEEDILSSSVDYSHLQQQFPLENRYSLQRTSSHTSESGYFSLAFTDTTTNINSAAVGISNMAFLKKNKETNCSSHSTQTVVSADHFKNLSNSQASLEHSPYKRMHSLRDDISAFVIEQERPNGNAVNLSEKLSIKIRYLLQLFIEANCIDYALVLSILLQDAASIGRIINVAIRSESLVVCNRIESALKRLTQWSFDRECLYYSFMVSLHPYIYLLDQYIKSSTAEGGNSNLDSNNDLKDSEAITVDGNVDPSTNSLESNANCKRSWSLEKYQKDGQRAFTSANSGSGIGNANTRKKSMEQLENNETRSCNVM